MPHFATTPFKIRKDMTMAKIINDSEFESIILNEKKPAVVDFYADWCGPCKMMAPLIDAMEKKYAGKCGFYKVNVDEQVPLAVNYNIASIPTLMFFANGELVSKSIGYITEEQLEKELDKIWKAIG